MLRSTVRLAALALVLPLSLAAQRRQTTPVKPVVAPPAPSHWMVPADSSNTARFIVKEQLAGAELPNDAVGVTHAVTGGIVVDAAGKLDSTASRITVDMRTLTTDKPNRDRYIKGRTIITDSFPNAIFTATQLKLTSGSTTTNGAIAGTISGTMTLHGVTSPISWDMTGTVANGDIKGTAVTHIHFGEYHMTQPRVMLVVSIVDDLKLEYDFHFVKQ